MNIMQGVLQGSEDILQEAIKIKSFGRVQRYGHEQNETEKNLNRRLSKEIIETVDGVET